MRYATRESQEVTSNQSFGGSLPHLLHCSFYVHCLPFQKVLLPGPCTSFPSHFHKLHILETEQLTYSGRILVEPDLPLPLGAAEGSSHKQDQQARVALELGRLR